MQWRSLSCVGEPLKAQRWIALREVLVRPYAW
jgi:hypothetical protein